jgi:hypothetical protein
MKHAIFSFDPGSTTGVAMMLFSQGKVITLKNPHPLKRLSVFELPVNSLTKLPGDTMTSKYERAALILYQAWLHFRYLAKHTYDIPPENHILVIEDYLLKPTTGSTKREALSPVYVASTFQGIRMGQALAYEHFGFGKTSIPPINWSSPSNKAAVDDARLRRAWVWIRGKQHGRDAVRHGMLKAMRMNYHGVLGRHEGPRPGYLLREVPDK